MLQLVCTETARQTLQEGAKVARQYIYDKFLQEEYKVDDVQKDVLLHDEAAFFDFLVQEVKDKDKECKGTEGYMCFLYEMYNRVFSNDLHSVVFGTDAYRAFKQQSNYLHHNIIKTFGVSVEASFYPIRVLTTLLAYFDFLE